jgi:hypothetical protein
MGDALTVCSVIQKVREMSLNQRLEQRVSRGKFHCDFVSGFELSEDLLSVRLPESKDTCRDGTILQVKTETFFSKFWLSTVSVPMVTLSVVGFAMG